MSNGMIDTVVRSSINTSIVNSIPAIGALKIPAIPAAAPQPTNIIKMRGDSLNAWPRLEPIAAPV